MSDEPKSDPTRPDIFPTVLGLGHNPGTRSGRVFVLLVLVPMLLIGAAADLLRHQASSVGRLIRRHLGRH